MHKERFLERRKSNLLSSRDGPLQVLEWINDNAYKLDLSSEYIVSTTFNVFNLSPFDACDNFLGQILFKRRGIMRLRTKLLQTMG